MLIEASILAFYLIAFIAFRKWKESKNNKPKELNSGLSGHPYRNNTFSENSEVLSESFLLEPLKLPLLPPLPKLPEFPRPAGIASRIPPHLTPEEYWKKYREQEEEEERQTKKRIPARRPKILPPPISSPQ